MKINKYFLIHRADDETILVPTGKASFSGIVRGNKTFGAVLELLAGETTEEDIISAMKGRFDAPEDVIAKDVRKVIDELRKIGAIYE